MENMTIEELEKEIAEFKKEKERVRKIIGTIGGKKKTTVEKTVNLSFLTVVLIVFTLGVLHKIGFVLSVEIGVLLVSLKIAWMIFEQQKINHFQFWILTSLEYRVNEIHKKVVNLEKKINENKKEL